MSVRTSVMDSTKGKSTMLNRDGLWNGECFGTDELVRLG